MYVYMYVCMDTNYMSTNLSWFCTIKEKTKSLLLLPPMVYKSFLLLFKLMKELVFMLAWEVSNVSKSRAGQYTK